MERALLTQKMMELDSSKSSTLTLQHELEMAHKQVKVLEQQVRDLQTEVKRLSETISHLRDDKVKLEAELEDQRRRNSSLELASDSHLSFLCRFTLIIPMYQMPLARGKLFYLCR